MRVTLPALMQEVQAFTRPGEPSTIARSFWMFGSHLRLDRWWEWETRFPKKGFFPQMSQTAAIARKG